MRVKISIELDMEEVHLLPLLVSDLRSDLGRD